MSLRAMFVVVSSLIYFMFGFTGQSINSALPAIAIDLEMTHSMTGLVLALPSLLYKVAVVVAAVLSRKTGPFLTMTAGLALVASSVAFMALSGTYVMFMTGRLLFGLGLGATEISVALCVSLLAYEKTGGVLNLVYSFFALGSIVAPAVVSVFLTDTHRWNIALFMALAAFAFVLSLSWYIGRKASGLSKRDGVKRKFSLPADSLFWLVVLGGLLYVGYEMGVFSWLSSYVFEEKALELRISSFTPSLLALGLFVGRLVTGAVVDRAGLGRTLVILGAFSLAGFSTVLLSVNPLVLTAGIFVAGLGFSGTFPTLQAILVSGYRERRETVLAVFAASGSLGVVITNISVGTVSEKYGLPNGMMIMAVQISAALAVFSIIAFSQRAAHRE